MSTSKAAIATKYKLFEKHDNAEFHSKNLPNPNVIRIEALAPEARARYLGGFFGVMQVFRDSLMHSLSTDDSYKPFYGFFDPTKSGDVSFSVKANWNKTNQSGFNMLSNLIKKAPVVGKTAGSIMDGASSIGNFMMGAAGLDNKSTGAGTMRAFQGADFNFSKEVECVWYMPEQENMARLSISRLLKLCFVRNFASDGNFAGALNRALKSALNSKSGQEAMGQLANAGNTILETGKNVAMEVMPSWLSGMVGGAGDAISDGAGSATGTAKDAANAVLDSDSTVGKVASQLINGGLSVMYDLNAFLGGSITVNPVPVRLTMGHIIDIEPLVIENVNIIASKEQFISEDGTHIPLFVTARIKFGMWMIPDPNKGFAQFMGDDVFNSGHNVKKSGDAGTSSSGGGTKKK